MTCLRDRVLMLCAVLVPLLSSPAEGADPSGPGPHAVGVRTEVFVDHDRTCAITGQPRTLVTEIWYPAAKGADAQPLNRFSDFWGRPAGVAAGIVAIDRFGGRFDQIQTSFQNVARRGADGHEGTFPLLLFSHGNGGFRHQNTFQAEYLASHGYIVAAPDHTGNAAITVLPDQIVPYDKTTRSSERRDDRPRDLSFLLSQLTKPGDSHWLAGRIDAGRVGAFGHSFGGFTVSRLTELDPRVRSILPMTLAGTLTDGEPTPCPVPLMVILADADRTVGEAGNQRSRAYFEAAAGPKWLLNFDSAGHYTFTEMRQINPNFGDGIGTDKDDQGNVTFTYSDAGEDQRLTNAYSTAFFNHILKSDPDALRFLESPHPADEFEYRSSPAPRSPRELTE